MKISILLPYKENFSQEYPGAVSIYVKNTTICSKFKNKIKIFGNTNYNKILLNNYVNLKIKKDLFLSNTKTYVDNFLIMEKNNKSEIFFLMGADNLIHFHRWHKWKKISLKCKILVFDRTNYKSKSLKSKAFKKLNSNRLKFIKFKKVNISSSKLRKI